MSIQAIVWVIELSRSTLGARHVLISIANHTDRLGKNAFPSIPTIAFESRLSESAVKDAIKELISIGELQIDTPGGGRGRKTVYSLPLMERGQKNTPLQKGSENNGYSEPVKGSLLDHPPITPYKEEPSLNRPFNLAPPSSEGLASKTKNTDPRWSDFKKALEDGYKRRGWHFGFNAADGKQLKSLLQYRPKLTVVDFRMWVKHYFDSDGVIPGAMPHTFLMKLPNYCSGPLNQFGKLMEHKTAKHEVLEV